MIKKIYIVQFLIWEDDDCKATVENNRAFLNLEDAKKYLDSYYDFKKYENGYHDAIIDIVECEGF